MPESFVNISEGSGKKAHTFQRSIGINAVEDEVILNGEPYLATYALTHAFGGLAIATANDHVIEINAGASLNCYLRRLLVYQTVLATTATIGEFGLFQLTSAGTGGTGGTSVRMDNGDSVSGTTVQSLPTVKGTESGRLWEGTAMLGQTAATTPNTLLFDIDFDKLLRGKVPKILAGTANGIALSSRTAIAVAKVTVVAFISEANF
jgi:hypothetical protein